MQARTELLKFPNEIVNDDNDHSIPDFWTECSEKNLLEPIKLLHTEGKRDLYGLCSPAKDNETVPQTSYTQTDDTAYEIYLENGENGMFCELWIPVKHI